jgi:hypothetical protein
MLNAYWKKQNTLAKKLAVLKTQLMYHKKVLKTKVHDKKLLAFSVERKSYSVSVMHKNLVTIVQSISESWLCSIFIGTYKYCENIDLV